MSPTTDSTGPDPLSPALAALRAIVQEIDGPGRPYSTDSWLPHHLLDQARAALALHDAKGGQHHV